MKTLLKRVLLALGGAAYGFASFWWAGLSLCAVALPLQERGSLEWEEDAMFIPLGAVGLCLWLASAAYLIWRQRKNKRAALPFWGAALLAAGAAYFAVVTRPL